VAAEALLSSRIEDPWNEQTLPDAIHRRIFAAVDGIPESYRPILLDSLQKVVTARKSEDVLSLFAAFLHESRRGLPTPEDVIPSWSEEGERLARRHLSVFLCIHVSTDAFSEN